MSERIVELLFTLCQGDLKILHVLSVIVYKVVCKDKVTGTRKVRVLTHSQASHKGK